MEETLDFIDLVQEMVLNPNLGSAIILFFTSFLNEMVAIFPYAVVLASQLFFLQGTVTTSMLVKLLVFVAVPVGIGASLGTLPLYTISYFGGKPAIERYRKYLRFDWRDVESVTARFKGAWYDEVIFFILRSVPILPSFPLSIAAGVVRMNFAPFFVLTTVGFIIRMMLTLIAVGIGVEGLSQLSVFLYTN